MRNPSNLKRKIVRDPHQRTITGRIVHILWIFVVFAVFVTATFGVAGVVAGRRLLNKTVDYLNEVKERDEAHFSLNGEKPEDRRIRGAAAAARRGEPGLGELR